MGINTRDALYIQVLSLCIYTNSVCSNIVSVQYITLIFFFLLCRIKVIT